MMGLYLRVNWIVVELLKALVKISGAFKICIVILLSTRGTMSEHATLMNYILYAITNGRVYCDTENDSQCQILPET